MEYRPTCGCRKQTICRTSLAFLGHFRLLKQSRSGFLEFSARALEGIVRNDDKCETERRNRRSSGSMESLLDVPKQQQRPISKKPRQPLRPKAVKRVELNFHIASEKNRSNSHWGNQTICLQIVHAFICQDSYKPFLQDF